MNEEPHICPWWVGYLLASPLRKLRQNPDQMLGLHVREGMKVVDFGCAMGFFSLPLARMVGPQGRVLCVDCQSFMLDRLVRRARRAGLDGPIEARLAENGDFGLTGETSRFDFALAFAVLHEVPDRTGLLAALHASLRPGAQLLLGEPTGHVTRDTFEAQLADAQAAGFSLVDRLRSWRSHGALLGKAS
jgi:2-polyprenyl-3-methyl-5-hydroxy-6-metoxy-1,4-benzoquinol methylase